MGISFVLVAVLAVAGDGRTQYPVGLANSFFEFGTGHVEHPFSERQLEHGYQFGSVRLPVVGARLAFGHRFTDNFSLQIIYARPIRWVRYENVIDPSGGTSNHSVLTNLAGLTLRDTILLGGGPFSVYIEGGLGIVTRSGFRINGVVALKEANYATVLVGGGLTYRLNDTWDLRAGVDYTEPKDSVRQPHTLVLSTSSTLNLRPRTAARAAADTSASWRTGAVFPRHLIQVGHSSNELGTGVNSLFSSKIPIFWGGSAEVGQGVTIRCQRNVFHTARVFSLDIGASVGNWWTNKAGTKVWSFSVYPQFRFTLLRTRPADFYLYYSLAGPTYISKHGLDDKDTARNFTFQDLMGAGFYADSDRHFNLEVGIGHFSNGNLTPHNSGVKLPFTVSMGYAF